MPIIPRPRPSGDFSPREGLIVSLGNPGNFPEIQELLEVVGDEPVSGTSNTDFLFARDDLPKTIYGLEGNDYVYTNNGPSFIVGDEGDDFLNGGFANDTILGGLGDDQISSEGGENLLLGNEGDDGISASGSNIIYAGKGDDGVDVYFSEGNNIIYGDKGDDNLNGALTGNDTLDGGEGNDNLQGFFGDDLLSGGEGWDFLTGNGGFDTLQVARSSQGSFDIIIGFEDGVDAIALEGLTYDEIVVGPAGVDAVELSARLVAGTGSTFTMVNPENLEMSQNSVSSIPPIAESDIVIKVADTDEVLAVIRPIIFVPDGVLPFPVLTEDDFISII